MKLAKIERINTIASIHKYEATKNIEAQPDKGPKQSRSQLEAFHKSYGFKINPELTEVQRYELLQLLFDYKDVFARSLTEIRECKAPPLRIDLHTPRKMFKRQFRLNEEDAKEVTRQIAEMEECGVIEPSDSAYYNSPVFLVKKRDGSKRLVVDLRGINSLIVPKLIQLPNIDELLQEITQEKPIWLTILDVKSAYWQCPIEEESRKYTTFCAPDGRRWAFRRCPFGLNSSPAHLLLVLGNIFADKNKFRNLEIYMDDAILYSADWQNHLEQLELTLKTFLENRFSCNPKKTELAFHKLEYLGFVVSGEGIHMSERRIEAVKHIYPPKNVKGLLKLLGMTNFWRRFIPQYSAKTYTMRQLLRKDQKFIWSYDCQKEFEYLKRSLTNPPILRPLDSRLPIIIQTDGSKLGFGFVILQQATYGNLHVVNYGAKATNLAQQAYCADDLEALALVYALKSIEPLAVHKPITVVTDNSHLLHLNTWKPLNSRQRRMITYLMQFDLTIRYIRGSRNVTPDFLSRLLEMSQNKNV